MLSIVLIFGTQESDSHLCGRIYKRGSKTDNWDFTFNGTGVVARILQYNKVRLVAPELGCGMFTGWRNGSKWQLGSARYKLTADQKPSYDLSETLGKDVSLKWIFTIFGLKNSINGLLL